MASGMCAYLVLCYIMVLSRQEETRTFLRRPYGFKMCVDFCSNLIGCSSFMFSQQELSCRVESGPKSRHRHERQYSIKKDTKGIGGFTGRCPNFSRLLFKRAQSQVCIDQKGNDNNSRLTAKAKNVQEQYLCVIEQGLKQKPSRCEIHSACRRGDVEVVKYALSKDPKDINRREKKEQKTPVMVAGEMGHKEVVKVLVENGADLSLTDKRGNNILHLACDKGHVEVVEYVLSLDKVDVNSTGRGKRTPLILAGLKGHKEVVELLIKHGANLSRRDGHGNNILHYICWGGHVEIVKYVLSLGRIDIDSRGDMKRTPLLSASHNGHKVVVELLLRNGANLSLRDKTGDNILHYICWEGNVDFVKYVLSLHKVDINQKGWRERTPLLSAGFKGHQEVVELLVQNGADLLLSDDAGDTILHYVCREGHVKIVKYILSLDKLDINVVNSKGDTAAKIATSIRRREVVDLLVSHGGDM